jgi:hypothetical protein
LVLCTINKVLVEIISTGAEVDETEEMAGGTKEDSKEAVITANLIIKIEVDHVEDVEMDEIIGPPTFNVGIAMNLGIPLRNAQNVLALLTWVVISLLVTVMTHGPVPATIKIYCECS